VRACFYFVAFLILISCKENVVKKVDKYHMNGNPSIVNYYSDTAKVKTIEYYANGSKKLEGGFKNGYRNGEWSYWYENGNLWSKGKFERGKSNGVFNVYNEDGSRKLESSYKNGSPNGKWTFFSNNVKVKEVYYSDGVIINEIDY